MHSTSTNQNGLQKLILAQRASDGYINASRMCETIGKSLDDFFGSTEFKQITPAFITGTKGLEDEPLKYTGVGTENEKGIWVHPLFAFQLAYWICPETSILVWTDLEAEIRISDRSASEGGQSKK